MMFNQYPYLNVNDLNLDYILAQIKVMMNEVTNFVSINAIKYADPIQWDITRQYEKNTIVIDPVTGTAYISVAPVPAGVALTRTEYWTVVFDLGSFVTRAAQNFTSRWESDTTLTATFPTNTGEWLVWGDVLYKALTNITAGDAYVVGGNIEHFTIEDLYNAYLNTIAQILAMVGDLADLTTSDTSSVVSAINSVVSDFDAKIGDMSKLITPLKTTIVNSINSIAYATNVLSLGCDNTGMLNNRDILDRLPAGVYYFPDGDYKIEGRVRLNHEVTLIGQSRDNTRLLFETVDESNLMITANCSISSMSIINEIMTTTVFGAIETIATIEFNDLYIETNSIYRNGIGVNGAYQNRYIIRNCEINANNNLGDFGIWADTVGGATNVCILTVEDCYIHGFNLNGIFSSARVGRYVNNRIRQCHWQIAPTGGGQIDVLSTSSEIAIHFIINNIIEDPASGASAIETSNCKAVIMDNTIYGTVSDSHHKGVVVQTSSQDYIDNNIFQGCYCGVHVADDASVTIVNNEFYAMGVRGCIHIAGGVSYNNSIKNNRNYLAQPFITLADEVDIPLYYVEGANTMQQYGIPGNGSMTFKLPYAPNNNKDSYYMIVFFRNEIDTILLANDNSIVRDSSKMTELTITRSGQTVTFTNAHSSMSLLAVKLL